MQALEMEQAESLVGNSRKKLYMGKIGGRKKTDLRGRLAALAMNRNFVSRIVVVAGVALLFLLYSSTKETIPVDTEPKDAADGPTPAPVAEVDATPAPVADAPDTPAPVAAVDETPAPVADVPDTPAPVAPPTDAPVEPVATTDPPTASPTASPTSAPEPATGGASVAGGDGNAAATGTATDTTGSGGEEPSDNAYNLYSKFATFPPLVDPPLPDATKAEQLAGLYGKWGFWDGDEDIRPKEDFLSKYPNKDCPGEEFPDDAWQVDAVFVNHYLNDADKLIARAMEAIHSEYGHPREGLEPHQLAERMKQFHWDKIDLAEATAPPDKYKKRGDRGNGGWTTKRSEQGLIRRLLHAMMTSDTFTVVMGGHSAAAGEGNHFRQSYMMQFHKVMAPIFSRLGVKLITRNMAMGGMGTLHSSLGSASIYGDEIDLLIWDTGMTEGRDLPAIDMFLRQGLISGKRVPIIWGSGLNFDLMKMFHEEADADIGEFGQATDLLPVVQDEEQANSIPWAARFMKCSEEAEPLCKEEPRFCTSCWVDREDGVTPKERQMPAPKGQVSWHPGWRPHQLVGRNLAFGLLLNLQSAINLWNDQVSGGPPLDDEEWHVTDYYENIRNKVLNLNQTLGNCLEYEGVLPTRICSTPMKGATQYTPRANPERTSITSILKPTVGGFVPANERVQAFEGPDPPNPCMQIPEGEVDVYGIVAGRRRMSEDDEFQIRSTEIRHRLEAHQVSRALQAQNTSLESDISPGKGWEVFDEPSGYCDGTYNTICGRDTDYMCVLQGRQASRGVLVGNEFSGWLVLNLADVKEGIIVLKLQTWHFPTENKVTEGWTSVNNERLRRREKGRRLEKGQRRLHERPLELNQDGSFMPETDFVSSSTTGHSGGRALVRSVETPELPEGMVFEYAIDGEIKTLTRDEFLAKKQTPQRVVELLTILDDPGFTSEATDVEVAIRMRGCERQCTFGLSHVYWA